MGELGISECNIVNVFSLTIAAMGSASVFFVLQRHKMGLTPLGLTTAMAACSRIRTRMGWTDAFSVAGGAFDEGFRYSERLLTVPSDRRHRRETCAAMKVGYSIADLLAKAVAGAMLFRVAAMKSEPVEEAVVLSGALRAIKG